VLHMNDSQLIEYIRNAVPSLIALYRFGSQAKGTAGPDSDLDLTVLASDLIDNLRRSRPGVGHTTALRCRSHRSPCGFNGYANAGHLDRRMPFQCERSVTRRV
jgi:hypothetical protein